MSSVNSPSDRNKSDEQIRRMRENQQERETEVAKKNAKQVKNLSESHEAEVERLKADHAQQLSEIKNRTQETLTRRDMQYQKEIGDLREMHQKQLQRLASDSATQQERTETSLKSEMQHIQKASEQQKDQIRSAFEGEIKKKDERFAEFQKQATTTIQNQDSQTKQKMIQKHDRELKEVARDRDESRINQQRQLASVRQAGDEKLRATQRGAAAERERLLAAHTGDVKAEQANAQAQMHVQKESADLAVRQMRDRYLAAEEKNRQGNAEAQERIKGSVNERVNDRMLGLEQENRTLKGDLTRERVKLENQKSVEMQNLRDNMQKNIDSLETMRRGVVDEQNKKTAQDIERIQKANTEALQGSNKFYQDKIAEDKLRGEDRFNSRELENQKLIAHEKTTNDTRFDKLKSSGEMEQGKMRAYFDRASETLRDNYDTTLKEIRERNQKEQDQIFASFAKQAQENDAKFQQKLGEVSVRYERQIASIQEQHQKDLKDKTSLSDRQRKELEKKSEMDIKTLKTQYEHRLDRMQEGHKREIEALQRKQEETLANLTKTRQT